MKKLMLALMACTLCLSFTGCSKSMDDKSDNGKEETCDDCDCKENCNCRHGKWGKDQPGAKAEYK